MRRLQHILGLLAAVALCLGVSGSAPQDEPRPLAVIVNPRNPTTDLTLRELRYYFMLENEFWSNREKVVPYLRPKGSPEMEVLLADVYRMTSRELDRYWVGKVFRGEIDAKPTPVKTAQVAGAQLGKVVGGITVVFASEVPEGVRVLTIGGKKPGDDGYPLVVPPAGGEASL